MNPFLKSATLLASLSAGMIATSSAAIVFFPNQDISIPNNFGGVFIDIDGGTSGTSEFAGADANFFFGGAGISNDADLTVGSPTWQPVRTGTGNLDAVDNLAFGTTVDASSTFSTGYGGSGDPNAHIGTNPGQFMEGVPGYLGFSLDVGGNTHYGWMEVTFSNNNSLGTINAFAYDDTPGAAIQVGVPEPTVPLLGLLALGGLALRRRR